MKTIKLILISLVGLLVVSCDDDETMTIIDYFCSTSYQLENKTDKEIYVKIVYGKIKNNGEIEDLSCNVTIDPYATKEICNYMEICGENTMIEEFAGEVLPIVTHVEVYVDNKKVNDDLFNKANWSFSANDYYYATYLIVVTDELINSVGYATE